MKGLLIWTISNSIVAFVVIDGTIGITAYSEYSGNFIPFLVALIFLCSIAASIVLLVVDYGVRELDKKRQLEIRTKLYKMSNFRKWLDVMFDISVVLILAIYGFTFSAIFYLAHMPILLFARMGKENLIDVLDEELAV